MQTLIPHFIHEQFAGNVTNGAFAATTMFVDVSGFTALTEALMRHEVDGAEIVATALNRFFSPLVTEIYIHGGFIATFAGDAFTALFPTGQDTVEHARHTAHTIQRFFARHSVLATKYGSFKMGVKIGLSQGQVAWHILGRDLRYTYGFRGAAITGCAQAEQQARSGEIIVDHHLYSHLQSKDNVRALKCKPGYYRIVTAHKPLPPICTPPPPLTRRELRPFVLDAVIDRSSNGGHAEFRRVASLFIAFDAPSHLETLNAFLSDVLALACNYGGYFNKLDFGDKGAVMLLLFGAPIAHENDLERAGSFLLALRDHPSPVTWRAGLTFGDVYAGIIGGIERCEYTVIGNIVNFAARLAQKATGSQILVPADVANHESFETYFIGALSYKGFSEPQPTYMLSDVISRQNAFSDQPIVGRRRELAHLVEAAQPIFARRFAGAAYIYGEAGIGKSHLAYALQQALNQVGDVTWMIGQTDQILRQAFNPFTYILKRYFDQTTDATSDQNKARFEARYTKLLTDLRVIAGRDMDRIEPLIDELRRTRSILGALLDLHWPRSLYDSLDAALRYQNILIAIKTWLLAESCLQPVVLVIEDLHWLDRASGDLLTTLTRSISDFPLFLLITSRYRDDGSKPALMLAEGTPTVAIDLQTLPKSDLQLLGRAILGGPLHTTLADLLVNRTQGNPFFAEQILYYYRDNHWLARDPQTGTWALREDLAAAVPSNVQAVLIARIDRLPPSVRELVRKASVLGHEFDTQILQHIAGPNIDREVRIGTREQIWSKVEHTRYLFKHRLMRDAVYGIQLRTGLRDLHRQAGEAYEALYAQNLTPHYADLAYHYDQANLPTHAYTYTWLAAQQAMKTYAYDQGLRYLDRALELATEPSEKFTLESWREDAYAVLGRRDEQAAQLKTLRKLAPPLGHRAMAQVTLRQATYLEALSKYDQAITVASEALAHAENIDDKRLEAEALALWGDALQQQGAYAEARERYLDGLARAQIAEAPSPRASNLKGLGLTAMGQSEYEAACDYYEAALTEYRELGDRWGESLCLKNLGIVAYSQGRFEASTAHFKATLAICQEIGNRREQGNCLNNLGVVAGEEGAFAAAQTHHEAALTIFQEVGDQRGASIALLNLGVIMRYSGAFPEAERYYEAALHIRQEIGDQWGQSACLLNLGILAYDRETYPKAQAFFDEALIICREIGNREIEGSVLHNLGRLARRTKDWPTAESYFQQALALRRDLGQPQFVIEEKVELAGLYLARGHLGRARDTLAPALDYLNENPDLDGTEYPFRVLGICIQVLRITDADRAEALLDHAYRLLQTRAAQIAPAYRDDFWRAIPEHRQIAAMWRATHQSTGDDDDGPGDG